MSAKPGPSPQPSPQRGEGAGWGGGDVGIPRPSGERDAGRQGEGTALAKIKVARRLRRSATVAETKLWHHLRNRQLAGWKFVRQFPIAGFYVDFVCREATLVVEVDGSQHARSLSDARRTKALNADGYSVLRFWNNEVLQEIDGVLTAVLEVLERRDPTGFRYHPAPQDQIQGEPS